MVSKSIKSMSAALAIGCAVFAVSAGPSQAGLIHDLSTNFGFGQIEFSTSSGNDVSDVVAFSYLTTGGDTFDINDISSIDWSIDTTWQLSLDLLTNTILFGSTSAVTQIFLTSVTGSPAGVIPCNNPANSGLDVGNWFCVADSTGGGIHISNFALATAAVHVPEPAAVATFLLGLAGMGVARRRRTMKAAA